jgi:hypothetical protein
MGDSFGRNLKSDLFKFMSKLVIKFEVHFRFSLSFRVERRCAMIIKLGTKVV